MRDMAIVFLHHDLNGITVDHLKLVKKNNPGEHIITVSQHPYGWAFKGGYSLRKLHTLHGLWDTVTEDGSNKNKCWASSDIAMCTWYAGIKSCDLARRYVFIEWDVRCIDISLREFWKPVWNEHIGCISIITPQLDPKWVWYQYYQDHIPDKFKPHLSGLFGICSGSIFSDQALEEITQLMDTDWFECFSELRMATMAKYLGYTPKPVGQYLGRVVCVPSELPPVTNTRGIWHPIKERK